MNRTPGHGEREPELRGGLALMVLVTLCCVGVPLLTAGGAGVLAGLVLDTWLPVLAGLALMLLGAALLWRRRHR